MKEEEDAHEREEDDGSDDDRPLSRKVAEWSSMFSSYFLLEQQFCFLTTIPRCWVLVMVQWSRQIEIDGSVQNDQEEEEDAEESEGVVEKKGICAVSVILN